MLDGNTWRALIGIRRGLKLLVAKADETGLLQVEAWTAEPGQSDGVAVVEAGDGRSDPPVGTEPGGHRRGVVRPIFPKTDGVDVGTAAR